jgi:hypothetical protein
MKTATEVQKEIDEIVRSINKNSLDTEVKTAKRKIVFLREIKLYLDTNPSEECVKQQKSEVQRRIELLPTHFEGWKTGKVLTKYKDPYASYCSEMGLQTMNAQIKTLDYLLI